MPERPIRVRHPLIELTATRAIEFLRDPGALFWVFGFPVVLAVVLGVAFRESPQPPPRVAVIASQTDPTLIPVLQAAPDLQVEVLDREQAFARLRSNKVDLVLASHTSTEDTEVAAVARVVEVANPVDAGLASQARDRDQTRKPASGSATRPDVQFFYDPMQPQSRLAHLAVDAALLRGLGQGDVVTTVNRHTTAAGSRYIDFLMPGLIGLNLLGSSMWGIGFAVVDIRRRRLLKRFAVTPMKRSHFLLAFMLSRFLLLFAEVALLLIFSWLVFGVGVRGSLLEVAVLCTFAALSFTGIAMMIAARPSSIEVASGLLNLVILPMWLLSGAFFSYSRFPDLAQPFIRALPLTAFNDALRAIMNEGSSLLDHPVELVVLAGWGLACLAIAVRIFRWQ